MTAWWKWPLKLAGTVPVVWLLVFSARDGGVLREVAALGAPLGVTLAGGFLVLVVLFCRDLERVLELLPAEARAASPRSVWWMLVIPFNFVEDFFIVANVTRSLERGGLGRLAGKRWAFGWCAAQIVSLFPGHLGLIGSVVAVPLWGLHWRAVRASINELQSRAASRQPGTTPAS